MPWKPSAEGEVPTLGWYVIDWMTEMLAAPAKGSYEPFVPYREQEDFILRWYELDPATGRFRYQRGLLGRPRGWGKSPLLAALAAVEALGDVLFDGWDAEGQPVGRPWSTVRTPLVHIAAVSEEQTRNTWQPLQEMLALGPVIDEYPGLEPLDTMINLPRGRIQQVTASPRSVKGAPIVFAVLDQTEEWVPGNNGPVLANNIRTNAAKNGGRTLESPNAYIPGEMSVAEASAKYAEAQREGRTREARMLWDHREAPGSTDLSDRESLVAGLRVAYGDSSGDPGGCVIHDPPCNPGHVVLDEIVSNIYDPAKDPQQSRSDYLNQITHAADSWVSQPDWAACARPDRVVDPSEPITLGFDGSRARKRGKADSTALVGCTVRDGHVFLVRAWNHPENVADWRVPVDEVDTAVKAAFADFNVVGFYADPAMWETFVASWEAQFGSRLKVGPPSHRVEWFTSRIGQVDTAFEQLREAIRGGDMTHDDSPTLTAHVLNGRMRPAGTHVIVKKDHPASNNKIDAAYAAMLAWQARLDAVAKGLGRSKGRGRKIVLT